MTHELYNNKHFMVLIVDLTGSGRNPLRAGTLYLVLGFGQLDNNIVITINQKQHNKAIET